VRCYWQVIAAEEQVATEEASYVVSDESDAKQKVTLMDNMWTATMPTTKKIITSWLMNCGESCFTEWLPRTKCFYDFFPLKTFRLRSRRLELFLVLPTYAGSKFPCNFSKQIVNNSHRKSQDSAKFQWTKWLIKLFFASDRLFCNHVSHLDFTLYFVLAVFLCHACLDHG